MLHHLLHSRRLARSMALVVAVVAGMWECAALMRSRVSGGTAHR